MRLIARAIVNLIAEAPMSRPRRFVLTAGAAFVLGGPGRARSQLQPAVPKVALLLSEPQAMQAERIAALRAGLAEHGLVEGRSIELVIRSAQGSYDRLDALAADLARQRVDVVVAFGIKALTAARAATATIPIVIPATSSDLVASGHAGSLARPGGNVTGSTTFGPEIMAKRLELLKELRPAMRRVAVLLNPANESFAPAGAHMDAAAKSLGLALSRFEARARADFEPAFAAMAGARVEGLVVQDDTLFGGANASRIARLALAGRLVSIGSTGLADAGGVIGYGRSDADLYRRGAYFVDRILKGTPPAELPIEQATRFELVVNLATARALGLRIPASIDLRAERRIE